MNDTVIGIILKQSDYREKDVMLSVLTKEYGKLSFIAPGARKITSKNAASLLPFTAAELLFDYREGKTIFRLRTARPVCAFRKIRKDLVVSTAAQVLCEAADALSLPGNEDGMAKREFELLETGLHALEEGYDPMTVMSLYFADLLALFGCAPDVDECIVCGKKVVTALGLKAGGFLCAEHAGELGGKQMPAEDLKRFRLICKAGLDRIDIVKESGGAQFCDTEVLSDFLRDFAGVTLRSFTFFTKVAALYSDN